MPEATIDENRHPGAREYDVRVPGKLVRRPQSKPQTRSPEGPSKGEFWGRVPTSDALHQTAALECRGYVQRRRLQL